MCQDICVRTASPYCITYHELNDFNHHRFACRQSRANIGLQERVTAIHIVLNWQRQADYITLHRMLIGLSEMIDYTLAERTSWLGNGRRVNDQKLAKKKSGRYVYIYQTCVSHDHSLLLRLFITSVRRRSR